MAKFSRVLPFAGSLPSLASSSNTRPVNVEWAGRGLAERAEREELAVPGARDASGRLLRLSDFVDACGARPKHHKNAEQRARQLAKTQYIKGKGAAK